MRAQRVGEVGRDNCLLPETNDGQNHFWPRPGGPRDLHSAERSWVGWEGQVGSRLLSLPPPPCPLVPAVSPQHAHAGSRISEPPPPPGLCLPRLPRLSPPAVGERRGSLCLSVFVQTCGLGPGCSGQIAVSGPLSRSPLGPLPPSPVLGTLISSWGTAHPRHVAQAWGGHGAT